MRPKALEVAVMALALVTTACTRSESQPETTLPPVPLISTTATLAAPTSTPATSAAANDATAATVDPIEIPVLPGHLVVTGGNGDIFIGENGRLSLAAPTPVAGRISQPTWSPDGSLLAYSLVDETGGYLVVMSNEGDERQRFSTPFAPFYIAWSPNSALVGALGGTEQGVGFGFARLDDGSFTMLAAGTHYYFDWSPSNDAVVSNEGPQRLSTVGTDGNDATLPVSPGMFQAPEWSPDGRSVFLAVTSADDTLTVANGSSGEILTQDSTVRQRIVRIDLDTNEVSTLLEYPNRVAFDLSPDGMQLAYTSSPAADGGFIGPLDVLDLDSDTTVRITDEPVLAFEWSPAGEAILYMTLQTNGIRWNVAVGESTTEYALQPPTEVFFLQYLQFWSQYARSMTLWAPDGSGFVYPVFSDAGDNEIWVQELAESAPVFIGPGVFAAWSP
ncbi:MAG: hypothetical protein OEM97_10985 [Acidimicrobiia bacterium]|nr:hypothetical protein [Acidimicrobiia bacterium]